MYLEDMTWVEVNEYVQKKCCRAIMVPIGAYEEHGPHLPIKTDIFISTKICEIVAEKLDLPVAPPIGFGLCRSTREFPGTFSFEISTFLSLLVDYFSNLINFGFSKFFIVTWHTGKLHLCILRESILKSMERWLNRNLSFYLFTANDLLQEIPKDINENLVHGGRIETSIMLYLDRKSVKLEFLKDSLDCSTDIDNHLVLRSWRKYIPEGYKGNPLAASYDEGKYLFNKIVKYVENEIRKRISSDNS